MVCTRFHLSRIHDFVFSNLSLVAEDTTTQRKLATGFSSDLGYDNGKVPNLGLYSQTQPIKLLFRMLYIYGCDGQTEARMIIGIGLELWLVHDTGFEPVTPAV